MTDPIANALDTFVPAFASPEGNWQEIVASAASAEVRTGRRSRPYVPRPRAPRSRRSIVVAVVVVAALAVTGVAIAEGSLFGIFGISNPGTPVTGGFYAVQALKITGAKSVHFCLYFGQTGSNPNMGGQCLGIRGLRGAAFPSPSLPVWDMSTGGISFSHGQPVVSAFITSFVGWRQTAFAPFSCWRPQIAMPSSQRP